jgi:DNA polymerase-4
MDHAWRPARRRRERRTFGAQRALGRGDHRPADLDAALVLLADRISDRMDRAGRAGRTVTLRIRFADYTRISRSHTLGEATAARRAIVGAGRRLLAATMPLIERRGITLVGLTVGSLDAKGGDQLALPIDDAA